MKTTDRFINGRRNHPASQATADADTLSSELLHHRRGHCSSASPRRRGHWLIYPRAPRRAFTCQRGEHVNAGSVWTDALAAPWRGRIVEQVAGVAALGRELGKAMEREREPAAVLGARGGRRRGPTGDSASIWPLRGM